MKNATLALFMGCGITAAHAEDCHRYGVGVVTGTIQRELFYGAPGFGENPKTDARGFYPVLKLDRSMHFCAEDGAKAAMSEKMQMLFGEKPFDKSMYGKHVRVTGGMVAWQTGWHHTPVILDVRAIRVEP